MVKIIFERGYSLNSLATTSSQLLVEQPLPAFGTQIPFRSCHIRHWGLGKFEPLLPAATNVVFIIYRHSCRVALFLIFHVYCAVRGLAASLLRMSQKSYLELVFGFCFEGLKK